MCMCLCVCNPVCADVCLQSCLSHLPWHKPLPDHATLTSVARLSMEDKAARLLEDLGPHNWSFDPVSVSGYVGLVNQGMTCYQNSLLQQLFMIPSLRRKVGVSAREQLRDFDVVASITHVCICTRNFSCLYSAVLHHVWILVSASLSGVGIARSRVAVHAPLVTAAH